MTIPQVCGLRWDADLLSWETWQRMIEVTRILSLTTPQPGYFESSCGVGLNLELERAEQDFPGGTVNKNLPVNAGDTGSITGPEKMPNAVGQRRPCASTTEPMLCNKRSHCSGKPIHHNEEQLLLTATRESLCKAMKTQHSKK